MSDRGAFRRGAARLGLAAAMAAGVAACGSSGSGGVGSSLGNLFVFGAEGPPPVAAEPPIEVLDCPPVTVAEGAAAMRSGGEGANVRSQVAIAEVARECTGRPDGTVVVKVGLQLRALLGPGAAAGRFDAPLSIVVKRGDQVLANRSRRVAIAVPAGQVESTTVVVEDGIAVPPGVGEFDIEVSLGAGPRAAPSRTRRSRS